jgi:hypothetical protein
MCEVEWPQPSSRSRIFHYVFFLFPSGSVNILRGAAWLLLLLCVVLSVSRIILSRIFLND